MATRDVFASHVERFDLNVIFESDKLNRADIGKAVSDKEYGLFKP